MESQKWEWIFFPKGEEVAIENHRSLVPVDKDKHTRVFEFKKTSDKSFRLQVLHVVINLKKDINLFGIASLYPCPCSIFSRRNGECVSWYSAGGVCWENNLTWLCCTALLYDVYFPTGNDGGRWVGVNVFLERRARVDLIFPRTAFMRSVAKRAMWRFLMCLSWSCSTSGPYPNRFSWPTRKTLGGLEHEAISCWFM